MKAEAPTIFDKARRRVAYARARSLQRSESAASFLLDEMAEDFQERLAFMNLSPRHVLIVGDPTENSLSHLAHNANAIEYRGPDQFDEELPHSREELDAVLDFGTLATVNDLPAALLHYRAALRPGGVFLSTILGSGSLSSLRSIMLAADADRPAARMHPMIDRASTSALLGRVGFNRQVVDSHRLNVSYTSFEQLLSDLRDQSLTNVLTDRAPRLDKAAYCRAQDAFAELAGEDGRVSETFDLLTMTGWKV
ncbi:methyltransferase [Altererythrobacter aurantiacus]|uniref:Methyltransferase n=1 Tax=Parapontixanthobacter aurantiacus TaxID=1463599 RepID=A0A844ZBV0_9SPHN|nr:methyltransferase [Parapontixanthobacter aurantiacus]MXO85268.1 methyltransferase [Parapontixanthobacter aurantiacus]